MTPQRFRTLVLKHYREHGRHDLPWRKTHDPYRILVSEIMLQQTQVDRVIPYYTVFLKRYPTARALAAAPLGDVLTLWQGLGYNRRAKMLHQAAQAVVREHKGQVPIDVGALERLPGIGPYTARAVAAFAGNQDVVFVETNIRTAAIHHFFPHGSVEDTQLTPILERALPKGNAREWYSALMDYGSYLKRQGIRLNSRTKGYVKQSTFKGSNREVRGALIRRLTQGPAPQKILLALFDTERHPQVLEQIERLCTEHFIQKVGARYVLVR